MNNWEEQWSELRKSIWERYQRQPILADTVPVGAAFPREAICCGCVKPFQQKSRRHWHCSEACRWKKAIRIGCDSAKRARERSREWYSKHRQEHIANVTARKARLCQSKADSGLLLMQSVNTEPECIAASVTSEPCENSLRSPPEPTTSKTITEESRTGEGLSRCA